MNTTYTIATTCPSPSMSQTTVQITADTYADAVEQARKSWIETRRTTSLHSGKHAVYYYHYITRNGEFKDRNTNSGVPAAGSYA